MPPPRREDYDTVLSDIEKRLARAERAIDAGDWTRIGVGGVSFGAKFADLSGSYTCWWRKDGAGMMHFRGLAGCATAAASNDPFLIFDAGLRMAGSPFANEEGFPVATNPTGSAEKAGMVMFEAVGAQVGQLVVREAISVGGWIALAAIKFLAEA